MLRKKFTLHLIIYIFTVANSRDRKRESTFRPWNTEVSSLDARERKTGMKVKLNSAIQCIKKRAMLLLYSFKLVQPHQEFVLRVFHTMARKLVVVSRYSVSSSANSLLEVPRCVGDGGVLYRVR